MKRHKHTSKRCFVSILWIVNVFVTIAKTFSNVVLQCLLIYYGYYIWIYLMTQDIVDFIVFNFFIFTCLWLYRSLTLKKEKKNYWTHQLGRTKFRFSVEINSCYIGEKKPLLPWIVFFFIHLFVAFNQFFSILLVVDSSPAGKILWGFHNGKYEQATSALKVHPSKKKIMLKTLWSSRETSKQSTV